MMNMKDNRSLNQAKEGFFSDLYQNIRLIIRLMGDSRVNIFLKALPVGALIYLVVPYDLLPINPLDDALVLWAGLALFLELCPEDVVNEHRKALQKNNRIKQQPRTVIDGEFKDTR
ncbi:MAG TPA: hypothetical protein PLA02_01520 [Brevefilum fermentans]|jgi:uncharacterized membrane protein YkvA (DUF1232 family)|uniref:DUF1232 domain-containing protein n=1 Tax=Candidatus Brevifilum fermentans TaxID=1986204 RepID=A0A1Y6K6B5_9CHLR|nr:hypothetical protein [Brevefilum fermentans]OQB83485.1 MAG: hypothetical protein BWX85_01245 [Chloroflexi bacterium ADurb.Bin120]SMX55183.1 conserved protein of unknown function [Brevefilum fermentans]HOM68039.1 hypothetical protein [Brevefilum fermentans]HPX95817.1 hypothetical protein [Brevefilum fermentans]HQA27878.1 hypothetical protein [Brevefilum fermentans]